MKDGGLQLGPPGRLLGLPDDLLGVVGGLLGEPQALLRYLLSRLETLPGGLLGGLQALLGVGEGGEEVLVSANPLLSERPEALLLLTRAPREGLYARTMCSVCSRSASAPPVIHFWTNSTLRC